MEKKNSTLSAVNDKQFATLAERALPCFSGNSVSYNADKNIFVTSGYTSTVGNAYYKKYRLSDRLCISCSLGRATRTSSSMASPSTDGMDISHDFSATGQALARPSSAIVKSKT